MGFFIHSAIDVRLNLTLKTHPLLVESQIHSNMDSTGGVALTAAQASEGQRRRRRRPQRPPASEQPQAAETDPAEPHAAGRTSQRGRGGKATSRGGRASNSRPRTPIDRPLDASPGEGVASVAGTESSARGTGSQSGRGRGRGRANRTTHGAAPRMANGRRFGGQLSQISNASSESLQVPSSLQGDAPVFQPGQGQISLPARPPRQHAQSRKRRASKSMAPDLPTRIHEDINNLQYECAICTNELQRNSLVWSCKTCWSVFHFSCIKKWSASALSERQEQPQNGEETPKPQWRCPGCNLPQEHVPKTATCWCGKEAGQRSIPGLPPFSCGQTCSREHVIPKKCPHPCQEICHAGPCPPCPNMGPTQMCFCGRESNTRRCVDTNYESGWSCGAVCDELMPCGEHYCTRPCHEGLCGACEETVEARCYCGKVTKGLPCCERGDEITSTIEGPEPKTWTGSFNCEQMCERTFDCLQHVCENICHPQEGPVPHCPRSPDVVTNCPCGKTPLTELSDKPRQNCEDPIPNCTQACLKSLSCGHHCQQLCHTGECLPCMKTVSITCRCGRTTSPTICHQGTEEPPQCMRVCRALLNCGRHQCDERCCSGERKASERLANKRKYQRSNVDLARTFNDGIEAEHICTQTCGRILKCGNHECQELCHRGPCGSCREAIFDDISCNCGRTVLQSPLPCGTKPPPCRYDCERPKTCGHPQVSHNCHLDDEACPKCPFLTTKFCMCGKHQMKNQPCWLTEVRCGEVCGTKLKSCGVHTCRKGCHRSGDCEDAHGHCQQECGKEKSCGHPDSAPCHAPLPCKEDRQCQHKIFITCSCQRIKKEGSCHATKHTRGNLDRTLDCDDECARLERNRRLALALNIDPDAHKDDHIPYSAGTLNMFLGNAQWAQAQEKEFRLLAADPEQKRLRFKPMPSNQRAFLHSLAEDFGFDSESMDPEPHRHVALFKTPRFVMAPMKTLAECARIRHRQGLAITVAATEAQKKAKASNIVSDPYNGYLLTRVSFGLTLEELRSAIRPVLASHPQVELDISFLPSEDVVLKASSARSGTSTPQAEHELESLLATIKIPLARQINAHNYGSLQLCRVDSSLNVIRRESDSAANGGWSQVAAKAAAPRRAPTQQPVGTKSSFTVLESNAAKRKKKVEPRVDENVADDWEAAEIMEEEREKEMEQAAISANASGDENTGTASATADVVEDGA